MSGDLAMCECRSGMAPGGARARGRRPGEVTRRGPCGLQDQGLTRHDITQLIDEHDINKVFPPPPPCPSTPYMTPVRLRRA